MFLDRMEKEKRDFRLRLSSSPQHTLGSTHTQTSIPVRTYALTHAHQPFTFSFSPVY